MTDYIWSDENLITLQEHTASIHAALVEAKTQLDQLMNEMKDDPEWGGDHRNVFLAWMDLLQQYHAKMADDNVGGAARVAVEQAIGNWGRYYQDSAVVDKLRMIQ